MVSWHIFRCSNGIAVRGGIQSGRIPEWTGGFKISVTRYLHLLQDSGGFRWRIARTATPIFWICNKQQKGYKTEVREGSSCDVHVTLVALSSYDGGHFKFIGKGVTTCTRRWNRMQCMRDYICFRYPNQKIPSGSKSLPTTNSSDSKTSQHTKSGRLFELRCEFFIFLRGCS